LPVASFDVRGGVKRTCPQDGVMSAWDPKRIGRTEILQCSDVLAVGCLSEIQNN
jgi:hypothetical protein